MSKDENANKEQETVKETATQKKARIAKEKADAKQKKADERKAKAEQKAKEKAEAKANKPPGVIASILEFVKTSEEKINYEGILAKMQERFPERSSDSMMKTIKAQLGGKKQPTRMEKEKGVEFKIEMGTEQVTETVGEGDEAKEVTKTVETKERFFTYVGETKS